MQTMTEPTTVANLPALARNAEEGRKEMVAVKVPQGYAANINIRLVPGRDIKITPEAIGCQPRQGADRRNADPLALPANLVDKLRGADKKVVDWLAKDEANARLFLARPVEALLKAGVELSRPEQKALDRTHRSVSETRMIAPGVKITGLTASAHPKGRIGQVPLGPRTKDEPKGDCDCGKKGKE